MNINTLNDTLKEFTNNNLIVEATSYDKKDFINNKSKYFKIDEAYVLFAGYFDYKGDLINIYHIPNKIFKGSQIPYITKTENGDGVEFLLSKGSSNNLYVGYESDLNVNNISVFNNTYKTYVMGLVETNSYFKISSLNCNNIDDTNRKIKIENINKTIKIHDIDHTIPCIKITNTSDVSRDITLKYNIEYNRNNFDTSIPITWKHGFYNINNDNTYSYISKLNYKDNTSLKRTFEKISHTTTLEKNQSIILAIVNEFDSVNQFARNTLSITYSNDILPGYNPLLTTTDVCYKLSVRIDGTLPQNISKYVKSIAYFYIEHDTYNSRILSQALCIPDTEIVNFSSDQKYKGQFNGKHALRFYPFEYLYNKISKIKCNIHWKYDIGSADGTSTSDGITFKRIGGGGILDKTYRVLKDKNEGSTTEKPDLSLVEENGIKILDIDVDDIEILNDITHSTNISLEYISNDNTSQQNIAGDSYYRTKDINISNYPNSDIEYDTTGNFKSSSYTNFCIADLINTAKQLYPNLDNQKLQIASSIIPINNGISTSLEGDTFLSYMTLRATTPASGFRYGDSNFKEGDSNATVFRWIFTFPVESKYNITARYSDNVIDKPYFLHNANLQKYTELLGTSYKVDNYINTDVGKGYNPVYNENGVENFIYFGEIPGVSNHPHRVIRSLAQNAESTSLNWRIFKTDDYKDLPFNRGGIISLKTDNKNLYIQQKYGLHILQQRDQLNNTDTGDSYLGTSDLFNMEPKEVIYSPSGYIGCENYFDTNVNVNGYIVIDVIHKKIFLVSGDKPAEISNIKTKDFFDKFLSNNDDVKRIINYSEDKNILYITQSNSDIEKTMSFSPLNKVWVSFHSYIPDLGFINRNGLFWGKNGKLYSPTLNNNKGKFFTEDVKPSIIQFILNENTIFNKLLKTIVWKDQVTSKSDNYIQHFFKETINHIMIHNDYQCSGKLEVNGSNNTNRSNWWDGSKGTNKVNIWRFNKFVDLVLRDSNNEPYNNFMINAITPDTSKLKVDYKWYEINRFICQFIYLTMWCDNTQVNHEWEIIDVNPEWQLDNRNDQSYQIKDNSNKQ